MKKTFLLGLTILFLMTGCDTDTSIYSKYKVTTNESETYTTYQDLTYDEYKEKIDNKESFVLLLYQTGCSHCESFEPKLNEIISYYNLKIYGLNLAELSDKEYSIVKNKTHVSGTPTTVVIKEGSFENTGDDKLVGDKDEQVVLDFLVDNGYLEEK
jgi:hypothetical protein